jgi:hypothetical protein
MVGRKGVGYSLEAIVAIATVIFFVLGGLTVPENQNWSDFRLQVASDDLTYALQDSGYVDSALKHGGVGSMQTAASTVMERDVEVSGIVSNLPIAESRAAFYIKPSKRFTQKLREVDSSDKCSGDLGEITSRSENGRVLRTDSSAGELADSYHDNVTLYVGDLDPRTSGGGDGEVNYDSVWVDNGTTCQFTSEEGPYFIDEIFGWENESYDLEWINADTGDKKIRLYRANQALRVDKYLEKPVNGVETFVSIDTVNFDELESGDYDVALLRGRKSVDYVDSGNMSAVTEFMEDGSLLVLANLTSTHFDSDDFMSESGFAYVEVPYKGSYSGGEIEGSFYQDSHSQDIETYFKGLKGDETSLSTLPSRVFSSTGEVIESSEAILQSTSQSYKLSEWNRTNRSMKQVQSGGLTGAPESSCYTDSSTNSSFTKGSLEFPDAEDYTFINAELGVDSAYCSNNDERGVKIDTDRDGSYEDERTLLNDQIVQIANRNYVVDIIRDGCNEGECLGFTFIGDRNIELVSLRNSFPGYNGGSIAVMGYEKRYESQDLRLIAAIIHRLRGDQINFVGLSPPEGISTSTYSGIKEETYLPYEVNMRWSK